MVSVVHSLAAAALAGSRSPASSRAIIPSMKVRAAEAPAKTRAAQLLMDDRFMGPDTAAAIGFRDAGAQETEFARRTPRCGIHLPVASPTSNVGGKLAADEPPDLVAKELKLICHPALRHTRPSLRRSN